MNPSKDKRKRTKNYKSVAQGGFSKWVDDCPNYCNNCHKEFKEPYRQLNRPNQCCRTEAFDDGYDNYCPHCFSEDYKSARIYAEEIWDKENPTDKVYMYRGDSSSPDIETRETDESNEIGMFGFSN